MDAEEVEVAGDLLGDEAGGEAGAVEAPVHEADGDQMPVVLLADRVQSGADPLRAISGRAGLLVQRDELDEVLSAESGAQPVAVLVAAAGNDRLVHQVVAEDRGAAGGTARHRLPERAWTAQRRSVERVVPGGTSCLW